MARILAEIEAELQNYSWKQLAEMAETYYNIDGYGYDNKEQLIAAILRVEYLNGSR